MEITKYSPFEQSLLEVIRNADEDLFRFYQMGKSDDEPVFDLLHISESQRKYAPLEEMTMQIFSAVQVVNGIPSNPEVKVLDYFKESWITHTSILQTPVWYCEIVDDANYTRELET